MYQAVRRCRQDTSQKQEPVPPEKTQYAQCDSRLLRAGMGDFPAKEEITDNQRGDAHQRFTLPRHQQHHHGDG
ncbi:hypothetical protein [Grimontia hollisae]|uniref:hypothetical protein n=1 Tax=Grimontia hollisae TaxID=673 RepID=UPI001E54E3BC|nr:hypothetical protein [Grimontia hollisae]